MSLGDIRISSSEIRRRITSGLSLEAAEMLGRVHSFKVTRKGDAFFTDEELALPPLGMKFRTAVFEDLPDFENFDEYDSIFWVEEPLEGHSIARGEKGVLFAVRPGSRPGLRFTGPSCSVILLCVLSQPMLRCSQLRRLPSLGG
jgi:hypothetical protein